MSYYLKSKILTKDMLGSETIKLSFLKSYASGPLEEGLLNKFPIESFGNKDEKLKVKGVKALLQGYEEIDAVKYDIVAAYRDIVFQGINSKGQIILKFNNEDIEAHSIYNFYSDFFELFHITKYANYCYYEDHAGIVKSNMDLLFTLYGDNEKQFRLLKDEDGSWGIRGITSKLYKKYDNSVVLYLALLALHKYSVEKNKTYSTIYSYISDSSLRVYFEQDEPIDVSGGGKVYLGLAISNGEIRNEKFKAELRYRVVNPDTKDSFSAIFDSPIFSIVHNMTFETIDKCLDNLFKLNEQEESLILFLEQLNLIETLTDDAFFLMVRDLLNKINDCSDISKKTRDEFKKVETERLINNTYNIIQIFGKLDTISSDVDEKVFIERIYHNVILDLFNKKQS